MAGSTFAHYAQGCSVTGAGALLLFVCRSCWKNGPGCGTLHMILFAGELAAGRQGRSQWRQGGATGYLASRQGNP